MSNIYTCQECNQLFCEHCDESINCDKCGKIICPECESEPSDQNHKIVCLTCSKIKDKKFSSTVKAKGKAQETVEALNSLL